MSVSLLAGEPTLDRPLLTLGIRRTVVAINGARFVEYQLERLSAIKEKIDIMRYG